MSGFAEFREKMEAAGVREAAIRAFERSYGKLVDRDTGLMEEGGILPVGGLPQVGGEGGECGPELLARTVVIKLNGGLGTSMGLLKAKSLLEVKDGATFLDLIVRQILALREASGARVRFLLMNSFGTSGDTLRHLSRYAAEGMAAAEEVEMMQNQVPKVDAASLAPVVCESDPSLEWCPPGHGDLYPALAGSGMLDRLLDAGVRYAFVSNSDNLGAVLDGGLLRYFARSGAPFLMEVTRRTGSDRKGGHLAVRKVDGRLVLREVAQCPEEDLASFQDIDRHRFFNTNNLWLRLDVLKEVLGGGGVVPLPMICNRKTVDPRDKESTPVFQLETAMGAAIECFEGAAAVEVPRTRFAPVKTTEDLLALRSDAYEIRKDGGVGLVAARQGVPPVVALGGEYKLVDRLDGLGLPSLVKAGRLELDGSFVFGEGVVVEGDVTFVNRGTSPAEVPGGVYCNERREF